MVQPAGYQTATERQQPGYTPLPKPLPGRSGPDAEIDRSAFDAIRRRDLEAAAQLEARHWRRLNRAEILGG